MLLSPQLAQLYARLHDDVNFQLAEQLAAGQRTAVGGEERDFWLTLVRANAFAVLRQWQQAAEGRDFLSAADLRAALAAMFPSILPSDFEQAQTYRISVLAGHEIKEDFHSEMHVDFDELKNAHQYSAVREFRGTLPQAFAYMMQAYERVRTQAHTAETARNCYYADWWIGDTWYDEGLSLAQIEATRQRLWQALGDSRAKACDGCHAEQRRQEMRCQYRPFWYTQMRSCAQIYHLSEGDLWQAAENIDFDSLGYWSTLGFTEKDDTKNLFVAPYSEDEGYTPLCFVESLLLPPQCFRYSDWEETGQLYYTLGSGDSVPYAAACRQYFFAEICRIDRHL